MASIRGLSSLALLLATLVLALSLFSTSSSKSTSTSTLYCVSNSSSHHITTLDPFVPSAQCFRVSNGHFTEVLKAVPTSSEADDIVYLDGHVLPGIVESHGHILAYGEMLESVSLYGAESTEDVRARIREFLKVHKGEGYGSAGKWVRGIGWDQKYFGGVMPTAADLAIDPSLADLYIMLDRVDVHCVLTSQAVLDLLPSPLPPSPPGGVVVTDPGPGVFCDNAMDGFIFPLAPNPSPSQKKRWFRSAMSSLNSVGIVGVGDAAIRPADVKILEQMAEEGEMSVRVNVMLECEDRNTYCPIEVKGLKILPPNRSVGGDMLMLGGVKIFADGALGSWGAALLEPYTDRPETSGTMLINETELTAVVGKWFNAGFQVNVHAIGDRANRAAIDAFENVLGRDCEGCNDARRLRIEHAQIMHPKDQIRLSKMGIIPSIQPTHATSDMAYAGARLGVSRLSSSAYRMRSLFPPPEFSLIAPSSAYLGPVLGSDFPVEPPNPFHGIYAAITRLPPLALDNESVNPDPVWNEEALSLAQALAGFTRNAAYAWFREGEAGVIAPGAWADWLVVDRDLGSGDLSAEEVRDLVVKKTYVGGRIVWGAEGGHGKDGMLGHLKTRIWSFVEQLSQRVILPAEKDL